MIKFEKKEPKTKQIAIRMTPAMYDLMCMYAEEMNANINTFTEYAIQQLINECERETSDKEDN